jgi:acyl dehydratase
MVDYAALKAHDFAEVRQSYTRRDTILYALGIGLGSDPLSAEELRFVYEQDLLALPTFATTLGWPAHFWSNPRIGCNYSKLLHGEQHLRLHRPLPPEADIVARETVASLTDLGPAKGAIAGLVRRIFEAGSGELLAECSSIVFLRGDGGFSSESGISDPRPPRLPALPDRAPDIVTELVSLPQAGLIYRLSGDSNPLHADPRIARAAGYPRPILHGLCTFGMAAHAVLKTCCEYNPARIAGVSARFTAPVFPGETLRFSIWIASRRAVHLRAFVEARNQVVLDNGLFELTH